MIPSHFINVVAAVYACQDVIVACYLPQMVVIVSEPIHIMCNYYTCIVNHACVHNYKVIAWATIIALQYAIINIADHILHACCNLLFTLFVKSV